MLLRVLGAQGPEPGPGGATAGFLVESEGYRLLIDAGSGVATRLAEHPEPDAVFLSHFHWDHMADLGVVGYRHLRRRRADPRLAPLPLLFPQGAWAAGEELATLGVFDAVEVRDGESRALGPLTLSFAATVHPIPCLAVRVEDREGCTLAYTADTRYHEPLARRLEGADLLLVEAATTEAHAEVKALGHQSAMEAGRLAQESGAAGALLVHLPPDQDPVAALVEAQGAFAPMRLGRSGQVWRIAHPAAAHAR